MKLSKIFVSFILIMMLVSPIYSEEFVKGDVIVVLRPSNPYNKVTASSLTNLGEEAFRVASFAAASGAYVKQTYAALSEASNNIFALIHSDFKTAKELTSELLQNPEVIAASPNYIVKAAVIPNDTRISSCWGLRYINAPDAWEITTGSEDIYSAVIDSGIDETNPDLTQNVATEYGRNTVNSRSSATDDFGHGTHVAGTIGAVGNNNLGIAGVNWNVKLISVKALGSDGTGSYSSVISAIDYVTELVRSGVNIVSVNLSLESYVGMAPTHDNLVRFPLWRAFKALDVENKTVIVVAAGNYSVTIGSPTTGYSDIYEPGDYVYPPSFQGINNMISVSALDTNGTIAYFSNRNANISAPGVDITSTWIQADSSYITDDGTSLHTIDGTSMAAPHVAGAAALLASAMPNRTAYQLRTAILQGSTLDLMASLNYQTMSADDVPQVSSEWPEYRDYDDYEAEDRSYGSTGGGSIGCGVYANIFMLVILCPLLRIKALSKV